MQKKFVGKKSRIILPMKFFTGDYFYQQNFIPTSVLPIRYEKQFGFQVAHSREHAILQLVKQNLNYFNED